MISLKDINITTEMLGIISQIDEFKGSWNAISRTPEKLQSLKKVATIESIGSSNRIEGNILTDRQVETILSNIKKQSTLETTVAQTKVEHITTTDDHSKTEL